MHRLRFALAFVVTAVAPVVFAPGASAQDATPGAAGSDVPDGCTVVAEGLLNPRMIAFGEDGTLYVTEAGVGGDETITPSAAEGEAAPQLEATPGLDEPVDEATPAAEEEGPPLNRGDTGQVSAVAPDGTQSVVASGLPSYSIGVGPTGIVVAGGVIWVANGGAAPALGIDPLPNETSIVSIDPATGAVTTLADLGAYEVANNPDGTDVNPNLYGMDLGGDGQLYVADAGGNTMYRVDPATGEFTLLGVIPEIPVPGDSAAEASPSADGPTSLHAVPTGVDVGADGNVYVGLLAGEAPGAAGVLIAQADGTFVEAATGLSVVVGVAYGPDGALYASEIFGPGEGDMPGPGQVVRVGADGTAEPVVEGLPVPNGIAFGPDGALYVVANSVAFAPGPPQGQVLRCDVGGSDTEATPAASAALPKS